MTEVQNEYTPFFCCTSGLGVEGDLVLTLRLQATQILEEFTFRLRPETNV